MLFRSATSAAVLACAATAVAKPAPAPAPMPVAAPAPYRLAVMPVPGLSLARRDTPGYQPDITTCDKGSTCAEACGAGFAECPSSGENIHCYNAEASQSCCNDGNGNSCDAGFYCTHDSEMSTWCCPDSMDVAECAAAYSVKGGLETPDATTSTTSSTSTSTSTTPTSTSTPPPTTSVSPATVSTSCSTTPVTTTVSTTCASNTTTSAWTSSNATATAPWTSQSATLPATTDEPPAVVTPGPPGSPSGGASASGVSLALIVAAAGFVALF